MIEFVIVWACIQSGAAYYSAAYIKSVEILSTRSIHA